MEPTPVAFPVLNVPLLLAVIAQIQAEPERWDQSDWYARENEQKPECGTACCIAGWAVALHEKREPYTLEEILNKKKAQQGVAAKAQRYLGLTDKEDFALFVETADIKKVRDLKPVVEAILTGYYRQVG